MPNPPKYKVSLKLPDKTITKIRPTILEALNSFELPTVFKSKAIISVSSGGKKASVYFWPHSLRKLFINQTAKQILEKRLLSALK